MESENQQTGGTAQQGETVVRAAKNLNVKTPWLYMTGASVLFGFFNPQLLGGGFFGFAIVNLIIYGLLWRFFNERLATAPKIGKRLVWAWVACCLVAIVTFRPEADWVDYSSGTPAQDMSHSHPFDMFMLVALALWLVIAVWTVLSLFRKRVKEQRVS
jgi:hypothetical protein